MDQKNIYVFFINSYKVHSYKKYVQILIKMKMHTQTILLFPIL